MKMLYRQNGMTMWSISVIILVGVFFLFLFFKLFPPYLEDAQISSAISSYATSPDARNQAPEEMLEMIQRRFDVDSVKNAYAPKDVKIVPDGNTVAIELDYTVEVEMLGNVSVLLYFSHRVPVR